MFINFNDPQMIEILKLKLIYSTYSTFQNLSPLGHLLTTFQEIKQQLPGPIFRAPKFKFWPGMFEQAAQNDVPEQA